MAGPILPDFSVDFTRRQESWDIFSLCC